MVSWWINLFDFSNETHEWCLELDLDHWMDHSRHPSNQTQNWAGLDVLFFYRFHLCGNCIFTLLVRILTPRAWKTRSTGTPSPHRFFVILLMSLRRLSSMDQQLPAVMKRYWQWNFGATGAGARIQTSQSWNPTSRTVNLPSLHIFCRKTGWYHHRQVDTALRAHFVSRAWTRIGLNRPFIFLFMPTSQNPIFSELRFWKTATGSNMSAVCLWRENALHPKASFSFSFHDFQFAERIGYYLSGSIQNYNLASVPSIPQNNKHTNLAADDSGAVTIESNLSLCSPPNPS